MPPIQLCQTAEHYNEILASSRERPVFLFKHSTACFTSAWMWRDFQRFAEQETVPAYWRILVIENRSLARQIAAESGVPHASPQALLFHQGKAVWHASHGEINATNLAAALAAVTASLASSR